jgi:hypothetical protein
MEAKLKSRLQVLFRFLVLGVMVTSVLNAQSAPPKQPVYIYLKAEMTDHVNVEMTEDRLRHLLPEIEKYRKDNPEAHLSVVVFFSGASSDALAKQNSRTHILDFVKDYLRRGVIEAGYDGADEPTYKTRPEVDFTATKSVDDRWKVRERAAERLLTEGRNPLTGSPQPGQTGGLKRMQEVFGEAACIKGVEPVVNTVPGVKTGTKEFENLPKVPTARTTLPTLVPELGGDSETVQVIRRYNSTAMMFGLAEDNPAALPGYGGALQGFSGIVSPVPETAPEVYWQDNVLRASEASNPSEEAEERQNGYRGLEGLRDEFKELDRSKIHVLQVELADERYYLQKEFTKQDDFALRNAYDHPESPKLAPGARLGKEAVDAAFAKEDAALQWMTGEFLSGNPGSRFVSNADLRKMTAPSTGFSVSVDALRTDLKAALQKWGDDTYMPTFFKADGHYLSIADTFQVLSDVLSEQDRTGKLPATVTVVPVYGPVYMITAHGPNLGEVTAGDVAHFCTTIVGPLHDARDSDVPKNTIPVEVSLAGINMNAAQFLRLMVKAVTAPSPDTKLRVRMTYMFPGQAQIVPKTRSMGELGAMWTVKPAPLTGASSPAH